MNRGIFVISALTRPGSGKNPGWYSAVFCSISLSISWSSQEIPSRWEGRSKIHPPCEGENQNSLPLEGEGRGGGDFYTLNFRVPPPEAFYPGYKHTPRY